MAVTSLWSYKNTVYKCISYVMNPEKTDSSNWKDFHLDMNGQGEFSISERDEKAFLISGIGGVAVDSPEEAAWYFQETKDIYHKDKGRQCYHGYQSFAADEVEPSEAHAIGVELAQRIWGDRFQVVVATHVNTGHVHNHFVINSVSIADGYKFYNSPEDYDLMRRTSDEICLEHGLSIIEEPSQVGTKNWLKNREAGQPYTRERICRDVDAAIVDSISLDDIYIILQDKGYELKVGSRYKFPALSPPDAYDKNGKRRFYRFCNLNRYDGYDIEDIYRRLSDPEYDKQVLNREYVRYQLKTPKKIYRLKINSVKLYRRHRGYYVDGRKVHSYFFYKYFKYKKELEQNSNRNTLSADGKAAYKELQLISGVSCFILKNDIKSINDVSAIKIKLHRELVEIKSDKSTNPDLKKAEKKKLEKDISYCDYILNHNRRSPQMSKDKYSVQNKERY